MADNKTSLIISAVDQTGAALKSAEAGLAALGAQAGRVSGILSGFAALAGATAFGGIIKGAIDAADELDDLAQKSGATVESLSAMKGVAKIAGADMEQVAGGLAKLSKNMVEAANGSGDAAKVLTALGVSVTDNAGKLKSTDQVMVEFAKSLQNVGSGTEKVAAAQMVLGKSGAQLLPFLNDLAAAGELQVKVTAEQAAAAANLNDNLNRLSAVHKAWANTVAMEVVPVADVFVKALLETAQGANGTKKAVDDMAKDGTLLEWAKSAATAAGFVVDSLDGVVRITNAVGKGLGAMAAQAAALMRGDFKAIGEIESMYQTDREAIMMAPLFSETLAKRMSDLGTASQSATPGVKSIAAALGDAGDKAAKAAQALADLRMETLLRNAKEAAKELDTLTKQEEEYNKALYAGTDAIEAQAAAIEREVAFYGMTESAIQATIIQRLEEARAMAAINGASEAHLLFLEREIDARRRIATASSQKEFLDTNKRAAEASAREWEKMGDDIYRSLTDALFRASETGSGFFQTLGKSIQNTIVVALQRGFAQATITTGSNALNTGINAVLGTSGANNGAGTNYLGLASNANSIYNLANGSYAAAATNAYSYGSTALGYTYGTSALSQQSMMLAAQESGMAASSVSAGSLSGLSTGTVAWVAAIVMGMYMSSEAWKAGIKWGDFADSYRKTDMYKFDGLAQNRDLMEEPARAILGDDIVDSEFWAIAFGSSLSAQIHEAFATATGNYGAPKTNVNTRFSASALGGITANPMDNGSTAYAGGQESLSGAIFNNAVRLALLRFSPTDAFDVTLAGHINNRGRSSNQKLSEVLQDGDTIYRHRTESGKGMADFQNYANDAIPKMQLAIIAEAMRDSSADYKGVVDMVLGTSKDLTDAIRDMSAWQIGGTLQSLFGIADAFDQVKTGLDGLPVQFADLATVAAQARDAAGVAVQNVQAQIASATAAGDTAAVKTLTDQLAALKSAAAETDAAAVTRVIRETQAFTGVLDMLGQTLSSVFDASNSSKIFALSESLVSVFGTIDALTSAVNGYVENFYTADEKRALQIERIQSRLAQGGLDFSAEQIGNATREQFRDVVEAVKLTGEQGIVAFKALMDVQGAFAALVPVADSLTQSTGRAVDVIVDQVAVLREALTSGFETQLDSIGRTLAANMSALQRAADLERQRATAAQQAAQEQIGAIKSLTGYLRDQISSLLSSDSDALNGMAESARKVIEDAVRASAAGYLPDQATLADAVSTVRQKMSESVYASSAERDYEALKLAGQLQQIKTAGDKQLPIAEQALNAANAQLNAIERSLDFAQKQVDLLRGIDESTLDLSRGIESAAQQLVEQFKTALTGLSQTILGALAAGNIGSADAARQLAASGVATDKITQVGGRPVFVSSQGALVTDDGMVRANSGWKGSIDDARRIVQEAFNAMAPADFYAASKAQGVSAAMIDAMYSLPPGTANDWAKAHGLPAFAQGANRIPQDMLAVVHKDEAIIPAAFNPWAGSAGGNDRLEARIVELIDQNRRLEDRLASIENHTRRTSSTLDSVTEGGNAMRQVPA